MRNSAATSLFIAIAFLAIIRSTSSSFAPWPYLQIYPPVDDTDERTPLYFALVLSLGGRSFKSIGALPGVQIALDYINNEPDVLSGYTLHYTLTDSQCNEQTALSSFFSQITNPPIKVGWIGSGCSPATEPTAQLTQFYNITQLSCVSSSPDLHDRERFRFYFQLLATDVLAANGFFGIIKHFGWKQIRLVTQDENIFTASIDVLRSLLEEGKVEHTEIRFRTDEGIKSINAFDPDVRIYVLAMYSPHASDTFCEAYQRGLRYPKYVFITFGWYSRKWWEMDTQSNNCTPAETASVIEHSLAAISSQFPRKDDEFVAEPSIKLSKFNSLYFDAVNKTENVHLELEEYSEHVFPYAYQCNEATLSLAYALNKTISDLAEIERLNSTAANLSQSVYGEMFNLENFTYANSLVVSLMFEHLQNTMFPGISGNDVRFNDQGTRDINEVRILQYQSNNEEGLERVEVGLVTDVGGNSQLQEYNNSFMFPSGVPNDGLPIVEVTTVSVGLTSVYVFLATAGILFSIVSLSFNFVFRNRKLIRLSSPNLNYIICLGAITLYINVIVLVIPAKNSNIATFICNINPWLLSLGYSLCYGIIIIKMIRVWVIFNKPICFNARFFRDYIMALFVLLLVIVDVVILLTHLLVEALRDNLGVHLTSNLENPQDIIGETDIKYEYYIYVCESNGQVILYAVIFGYKGLLQVIALLLAFRTRDVKVKGLDDSVYIAACVYTTSIVLAVIIVSTYTLTDYVNAYPAVVGMGLLLGTTVILGLVFIPRMVGLYKDPKGDTINTQQNTTGLRDVPSTDAANGESDTELKILRRRVVELEATLHQKTQTREESVSQC